MSKVKNPKLAKQGKISYEWARTHMDILDNTLTRLKKSKPLKGVTIAFCLHITKETSVLLMGAKELGANVAVCGGNPLTTQDHIAAFLATQGIHIYAWNGQTNKEYDWCLDQVLNHKPDLICDDGADMNVKVHFDKKFKSLTKIIAPENRQQNKPAIATVVNFGVSFFHLKVVENTAKPIDESSPKIKPTIVF